MNRDYENSSVPSSKTQRHKKITNSREKSGRKPGGQPGHEGRCRKKQQHIAIRLMLDVTEYHADVYYNSKTGERMHAAFPEGVVDDVNYDGSIKAFLFLLNNDCCVSIDKSRKFLSELTDGKLNISKGMINKLSREFAQKSQQEQKKIFADILLSPVMHTDCTNARVNGKSEYVFVCAAPDGKAMYFAREKKGHEGIKGTPVEDYQEILVHDHEKTFYNYGSDHQECLAHIMRYLKDSMDNEPEREWSSRMRSLLQEMIHYRNSLPEHTECSEAKIQEYEAGYKEILEKAHEEYEYIPATNNEAERLLRNYKRKQMQAVSFRSSESIDCLCQCMSMLIMMRQKGEPNIFKRISQIFG